MSTLLGSVTDLDVSHRGGVVLVGSHGAKATGAYALRFGISALICHDAGIGMDNAGIAALDVLERNGVVALSVSHTSARIGDAHDMARRGCVSCANLLALEIGVRPNMHVSEAIEICRHANLLAAGAADAEDLSAFLRHDILRADGTASCVNIEVVACDSASSLFAQDDGRIVLTGSHGGLPGGVSTRAAKARPLLVAFNDAGVGIDDAGIGRLPILNADGIAAVCVSAKSARIGEGLSTYKTGIISQTNSCAAQLGARIGMPIKELVHKLSSEPISGAVKRDLPPAKTI